MAVERGKRQLENMLAFVLILIVMASFYGWIGRLLVITERASIDNALANIRSAVQVFELSMLAAGRQDSLADFAGANPLTVTGLRLPDYVDAPYRADAPAPGRWMFDTQPGELVYQLIDRRAADGATQLRYRLVYRGNAAQAARLQLVPVHR